MKPITASIVLGRGHNPWENLALEEYWMRYPPKENVIFYLWQNQHTIVIGRNQNPWKEVSMEVFEEEGGKLARRLSGGGAVYHDLGNLNFSFIADRSHYDLETQFSVILHTLRGYGLDVQKSGRNDMLLDARKFSGNAYYYLGGKALHHGTILVHADLERAGRYLSPSKEKLNAKGVASVRSRIINLQEKEPDLSIDDLISRLQETFLNLYSPATVSDATVDVDEGVLREMVGKHASDSWRYGNTPDFEYTRSKRFDWGEVELCFHVSEGRLLRTAVFSDSLYPDFIDRVGAALTDIPFRVPQIVEAIGQVNEPDTALMKTELLMWVKTWDL